MAWHDQFPENPCVGIAQIRRFNSLQELWESTASGRHLAWYLKRVHSPYSYDAISDCIAMVGRDFPLVKEGALEVSRSCLMNMEFEQAVGWACHATGFADGYDAMCADVIRMWIPVAPTPTSSELEHSP